MRVAPAIAALVFSGCTSPTGILSPGDAGHSDAEVSDAGISDAGPSRVTIEGSRFITYQTTEGDLVVPAGDIAEVVAVLSLDERGEFAAHRIEVTEPGRFVARDVPVGTYYVRSKLDTYIVTDSTRVDIGYTQPGRPDVAVATSTTTSVELEVDGAIPFARDDVRLYCENTSLILHLDFWLGLAAGTTTIAGRLDDEWSLATGGILIDGARGDRVVIAQSEVGMLRNGDVYTGVSKVFEPPPFTMAEGVPTFISGSFVDPPPIATILDWRKSEFAALATEPAEGSGIAISAGIYSLLEIRSERIDDLSITFVFGDLAPERKKIATAYVWWTSPEVPALLTVGTVTEVSQMTMLRPMIGPVSSPKIEGDVVSWDASAALYSVSIFATNSLTRPAVTLIVDRTRVRIPPDTLTPGVAYVAQITAYTGSTVPYGYSQEMTPPVVYSP